MSKAQVKYPVALTSQNGKTDQKHGIGVISDPIKEAKFITYDSVLETHKGTLFCKRAIDITLSATGLLLLLPLFIVVYCVMKMCSPGPVLFRQIRVGRNRKEFEIIKFRTMVVDAEKCGKHFTTKDDKRITPIGKVLRKTKIDELPELWNVLIGEMSLVGPRPMVPKHVQNYQPEWERVFCVRPGITDLATLYFRDEESMLVYPFHTESFYKKVVLPKKMSLILEYVDKHCLWLDVKILVITVWSISFGRVLSRFQKTPDPQEIRLQSSASLKHVYRR